MLVTGCCGFIGSHLVEYLCEHTDFMIKGIDNFIDHEHIESKYQNLDILKKLDNFEFIEDNICSTQIIQEWKPDIIVHLAGLAGVRKSIEEPEKYILNNVYGHTYLLQEAVKNRVSKFIYASSSSVYGSREDEHYRFKESDAIHNVESPYALSKWMCEKVSTMLSKNTEMTIVGCRFFSVYGPRGRPDMAPYKFFSKMMNNQVIEVYGDGYQKRDFTYVGDVVRSIHLLMTHSGKLAPIYNICKGETVSINDLIHVLETITRKKAIKIHKKRNTLDVNFTFGCHKNLEKDIHFVPRVCLEDGIKEMVMYHTKS